jgi:phage N-6-adenine-methyltransferase
MRLKLRPFGTPSFVIAEAKPAPRQDGFKAQNHPQQVAVRDALDPIDDRATPPEWFAELHARFHFTLDAAAAPHNTKLPRYFTYEDNGLAQSWAGERVFCNPPFSNLPAWVKKAHEEAPRCQLIVLLLPANRCEQKWWHDYIEPYRDRRSGLRVEFVKGRKRFIGAGENNVKANDRPPFGVCLVIWQTGAFA